MDGGGDWKREIWTYLCAGRRIRLQLHGIVARPGLLGRRNGLARGIYNRPVGDDRFSSKQILSEAQVCLNAGISTSGFSAYQMNFCLGRQG